MNDYVKTNLVYSLVLSASQLNSSVFKNSSNGKLWWHFTVLTQVHALHTYSKPASFFLKMLYAHTRTILTENKNLQN